MQNDFVPKEGMTAIYGLFDPREPLVFRYIGRSITPAHRWLAHCHDKHDSPKVKWIASLKLAGYLPGMQVIEWIPTQDAHSRECWHISRTKGLTNSCIFSRSIGKLPFLQLPKTAPYNQQIAQLLCNR